MNRPPKTILVLPYVNHRTGIYMPESPSVHEKMVASYKLYSYNYWKGVRVRQAKYIEALRNSTYN